MKEHTLHKNQKIGQYSVIFFLKKGSYAETYRVKSEDGKLKILKLFHLAKLHRTQFDKEGNILEIEILKQLNHSNLLAYCDSGETIIDNQKYAYAVCDFIIGETLADKMKREKPNKYQVKNIILGVLNGLNYLHSLDNPIIHNEITNQNVMLDLSKKIEVSRLIDFGYARFLSQSNRDFMKEGLNPFYQANESFNKIFSIQSDIFQVGVLYYHLLEGLPPWFIDISPYKADRIDLEDAILRERTKPLVFSEDIDKQTQNIIKKALQPNAEHRFIDAQAFVKAINGETQVQQLSMPQEEQPSIKKEVKKGAGFSAIAGMQDLKDTIKLDVIDALNNKAKYAEYGLTIPNGMLLYGPPGCGKTFFAEKLAEEIGFNFYQIKPSDIQSKWVNASQENIKKLFDEARTNAPSIIFIDELDALVPNRNNSGISHMNTSAVNEFLTQMNNCGEDGIFVIGATNRPKSIDPAILRAGRLDKTFFLPPPDVEARKKMFELYLEKRPREIGLDYEIFAKATENYVSSDIKFLCDEAARAALKQNTRISKVILLDTIKRYKSSLSVEELESYNTVKKKIENKEKINTNERPKIGFKR